MVYGNSGSRATHSNIDRGAAYAYTDTGNPNHYTAVRGFAAHAHQRIGRRSKHCALPARLV